MSLTYATVPTFPTPNMSISSGAKDLVTAGWSTAQNYASNAVSNATTFLDALKADATTLTTLPTISDALGSLSKTIGVYVSPAAPAVPVNAAFNTPAAPSDPNLATITAVDVGTEPIFGIAAPTINYPTAPAALTASAPSAPVLANISLPSAPVVDLPAVPTLNDVVVPTSPLLSIPTFTAVTPNSPQAPLYTFSFADTSYTSTLLDSLRTTLQDWVNGAATGLSATVEQAIWDRGRARETLNAARKAAEAVRNFAMRGFSKPAGALALEIAEATQGAQDANSALSRDVMIKQADLEQSNRRFAFEEAFKVEAQLIQYNNLIAQRAFDAARYAQEAAIEIHRSVTAVYVADVQKYSASVEQWRAAIQAELTKLEKYRSDLEGQRLIGEMDARHVEIYRAQVEAAKTVVEIFRTSVEAANAQAVVNKTQIEAYGAQVGAYGEVVRAKATEFEGYATQIRAEVSKVDAFKAQADAYGSQVNSFTKLVDARIAAKEMEIKTGIDVPMDLFKARTEVYRTSVEAEARRVEAVNDGFSKQVQLYSAQVQGQTGRMSAEAEAYRSEVQYQQAAASTRIEVARYNIDSALQRINALIEATKAGAQVSAQMAASALSAVNLSGSLSDSSAIGSSQSLGYNYGYSSSNSAAVSSSESTNNSTSTSTSTSTSNSTNQNYNY